MTLIFKNPLRNTRLSLNLTTTEAGQFVNVTRKTWESWEANEDNNSKGRPIPEEKKAFFFNKIESIINREPHDYGEIVVLFEEDNRFERAIATLSEFNFLDCKEISTNYFEVRALTIDIANRPGVSVYRINSAINMHVLRAIKRWKNNNSDLT